MAAIAVSVTRPTEDQRSVPDHSGTRSDRLALISPLLLPVTRADVKVLLDRMEAVVDDLTEEGDLYLDRIRGIRKYFGLYEDLNEPIRDKDVLYRQLEQMKYDIPLAPADVDSAPPALETNAPTATEPQTEPPSAIPDETLNT